MKKTTKDNCECCEGIGHNEGDQCIDTKKKVNEQRIPKCICGKEYARTYDPTTKEISPYLWIPTCDCINRKIILSVG